MDINNAMLDSLTWSGKRDSAEASKIASMIVDNRHRLTLQIFKENLRQKGFEGLTDDDIVEATLNVIDDIEAAAA